MEELKEIADKIIKYGIATEEELRIAFYLCGYNIETLNNVIFIKTAYRDIKQYEEFEGIEE